MIQVVVSHDNAHPHVDYTTLIIYLHTIVNDFGYAWIIDGNCREIFYKVIVIWLKFITLFLYGMFISKCTKTLQVSCLSKALLNWKMNGKLEKISSNLNRSCVWKIFGE